MKLINKIKNNTLLIVPINIKEEIITEITKLNNFLNIKYISFEEIEKIIYNYGNEAIYYLMNKYNYKYDVAKVYLENIRYISSLEYDSKKLNDLVKLRDELLTQKLISYNQLDNFQYDNITIYGYTYINYYRKSIINSLKENYNVTIIEDEELNNDNKIYQFNSIKDEISAVAHKICSLITNGIKVANIKLIVEDKSYYPLINYIFAFFNLKTSIRDKITLDITTMGKYFLANITDDINLTLTKIKQNFDMNNPNNILVYNEIIKALNKYEDKSIIRNLIKYDFKKIDINKEKYTNEITVIPLMDSVTKEEDYVFILGFNQKIIPFINKDEGFLNDNECRILNLETSKEKNINEKKAILTKIKTINNLTITYKLFDNNDTYLISTLNEELGYDVVIKPIDYNSSNTYNKIILSTMIDKLVKYSIHDDNLDKLYSTYPNIKYLSYDNTYTGIDKNSLLSYIDNKLVLSYTSLTNYFECGFKYYLSNILKLVPFEKTYMTLIGETFHYILSKVFDEDIDIDYEYDEFIKNTNFEVGPKEEFFFRKLKEELKFIITTIKKQYQHISFDKAMYEEKVVIEKLINDVNVSFMGVIDKLMYKEKNRQKLVAIIDYKTGNADINLSNIKYGLDMQLPIYLYLAKNITSFEDIEIVGFYLQKLLHSEINKDYSKDYYKLKSDKLKLTGYSIDDISLLEEFDDSYNKSEVIKSMATTTTGAFNHYAKVIDKDKIDKIKSIVEDKIDEATTEIINANFKINPKHIGKDNKACKYCMFYDVCYATNKDIVNLEEASLDDIFEQ